MKFTEYVEVNPKINLKKGIDIRKFDTILAMAIL